MTIDADVRRRFSADAQAAATDRFAGPPRRTHLRQTFTSQMRRLPFVLSLTIWVLVLAKKMLLLYFKYFFNQYYFSTEMCLRDQHEYTLMGYDIAIFTRFAIALKIIQ